LFPHRNISLISPSIVHGEINHSPFGCELLLFHPIQMERGTQCRTHLLHNGQVYLLDVDATEVSPSSFLNQHTTAYVLHANIQNVDHLYLVLQKTPFPFARTRECGKENFSC